MVVVWLWGGCGVVVGWLWCGGVGRGNMAFLKVSLLKLEGIGVLVWWRTEGIILFK